MPSLREFGKQCMLEIDFLKVAQDGGDGEVKVSPRDIVYTLSAEDAAASKSAQVLATTDLRYPSSMPT